MLCFNGKVAGGNQQLCGYVEDIKELATTFSSMFYVVSRSLVSEVDVLAKRTRLLNSGYVNKWY